MLRRILTGADKGSLHDELSYEFLNKYPQFDFRKRKMSNPSGYIVDTLRVVLQSFFEYDSFEKIMIDVVNRGGDADTTGAIAGMLAGAYYGVDNIPQRWRNAVDRRVVDKCQDLADRLLLLSRDAYKSSKYINQVGV